MSEGQKLGITVGVIAVAIIGLLVWLYMQLSYVGWGPFESNTDSLAAKERNLNRKLNEAQSRIDQIPERREELSRLEKVRKRANQLLPQVTRPDELLRFIYQKAKEANVSPRFIKPSVAGGEGGGEESGGYQKWTFRIDLVGTYDEIGSFVNKMEEFEISVPGSVPEKRFFRVSNLKIVAAESGMTEGGRHECSLTVETYRYTGS